MLDHFDHEEWFTYMGRYSNPMVVKFLRAHPDNIGNPKNPTPWDWENVARVLENDEIDLPMKIQLIARQLVDADLTLRFFAFNGLEVMQ